MAEQREIGERKYGDNLAVVGQPGIATEAFIKALRLFNILVKGHPIEEESLEDSWRDLAVYSALGWTYFHMTQPKCEPEYFLGPDEVSSHIPSEILARLSGEDVQKEGGLR